MSQKPPAESGNESGARCVLWHARGTNPPAALLHALSRRGFVVRAVQSRYAALADLCVLEHRGGHRHVLLLAEPESLAGVRELLAAARRYSPHIVTWVYEAGANKQLRELVEEMPEERQQPAAPAMRGVQGLRLAGEGPDQMLDWPEDEEIEPNHLLTDEELALLLDEPEPRGSADAE